MWYDINTTLSYNALINMVVGGRGVGKTYALKKKALQNYQFKKEKFVYVRRYANEMQMVQKTLFNDINLSGEFGMVEFEEGCFWIGEDLIGYAIPLSVAHKMKSSSYPDVSLIIFDEFIINPSLRATYLKDEVTLFLDLAETIIRMRDNVRIFLLANSLSIINPYTIYFGLEKQEGNIRRTADKLVLMQILETDPEFVEAKQKTKLGRLIKDSEYGAMSLNNQFILDSDMFIEKRTPRSRYYLTFRVDKTNYGVWYDLDTAIMYISETVDKDFPTRYCRNIEDMEEGFNLVRGQAMPGTRWRYLTDWLNKGRVRFETLKCKNGLRMMVGL